MSTPPTLADRARGCLLGLAVGDALGASVEFRERGSFKLTDMLGGGPHDLRPGQWTDDTSMALCLATSLVERRGFDAADQMRRYTAWVQQGYLSSTGACFDIGRTTSAALERFARTGDPWSGSDDPQAAGNGSIMRLAPVAICFHPDREATWAAAAESSRTTHAAPQCLAACRLLSEILRRALSGAAKDAILFGEREVLEQAVAGPNGAREPNDVPDAPLLSIARGEYRGKREAEIHSSGYVVHTLEAALWCFHRTDDFEAAVLAAANLGEDADTTAAVCGQVAGAHYGEQGLPARWLERLTMRAAIASLADRLRQGPGRGR